MKRVGTALLASSLVLLAGAATAQRRTPARPAASAAPSAAASATPSAGASATPSASPSAGAAGDTGGAATQSFELPMVQRGNGALTHYPVPEQLARNDVPVFVQVRTNAPLDHVSMHYRAAGAARFRELRLTAMGGDQQLAGGYGAHIPCDDAFPPAVEYYIVALDTSGTVIGAAGSETAPIRLPIVAARTHPIVPTLPGQAAPRNCGSLLVQPTPASRDAGVRPGTPAEEERGTADLGEPCRIDRECRRGLRCGSSRTCVFVNAN